MTDTRNTSLGPEAIRLECLQLAHRHDKDAQSVIDRAAQYERFVTEGQSPTVEAPIKTDKPTAKARSKSS
jgi:hypothetical protein